MDIDDIQWRARVIRVPRPKVGTPLVVPLTDEVATALVDYLRQRVLGSPVSGDCFCASVHRGVLYKPPQSLMRSIFGQCAPVCMCRALAVRTFFAMDWPCIFSGRAHHSRP